MAQLGERQTEDLKVPGSVPGLGMLCDALFKLVARHSAQLYPVRLLHGIALYVLEPIFKKSQSPSTLGA